MLSYTPHIFSHWQTPKPDTFHLVFGWTHQPRWRKEIFITAGHLYGKLCQRPREENHIDGWSPFSLNKSLSIALNPKPPCCNFFFLFLHLLINSNIQICSLHFLLKLGQAQVLLFKAILFPGRWEQRFYLPARELESGSCSGHRDLPGSLPGTHGMLRNESSNPSNLLVALKNTNCLGLGFGGLVFWFGNI